MLCVEWEALERKLATGGHDGHVRVEVPVTEFYTHHRIGQDMGSKNWQANWRRIEGAFKMGHLPLMGANTSVSRRLPLS